MERKEASGRAEEWVAANHVYSVLVYAICRLFWKFDSRLQAAIKTERKCVNEIFIHEKLKPHHLAAATTIPSGWMIVEDIA